MKLLKMVGLGLSLLAFTAVSFLGGAILYMSFYHKLVGPEYQSDAFGSSVMIVSLILGGIIWLCALVIDRIKRPQYR